MRAHLTTSGQSFLSTASRAFLRQVFTFGAVAIVLAKQCINKCNCNAKKVFLINFKSKIIGIVLNILSIYKPLAVLVFLEREFTHSVSSSLCLPTCTFRGVMVGSSTIGGTSKRSSLLRSVSRITPTCGPPLEKLPKVTEDMRR